MYDLLTAQQDGTRASDGVKTPRVRTKHCKW